nr:ABC transporter ATP-binding protein [Hydrogenispora ethanolica]
MMDSDPNSNEVLAMRNICKSFPGVRANRNMNFGLRRGEVHALLGENGAGKTTLMKILYGLYKPDSGEILLHGRKVEINSPLQAIRQGIGMVHQHFMLIPPFTVLENVILGDEPKTALGRLDRARAVQKITMLTKELGLKIDLDARIQDISVGLQQRVEIIKALYREAEILVLDEPTSVLTPQEAEDLGKILRNLVSVGKSVIFITHKLKEVMKFADRITVIRQGEVINTVNSSQTDMESLAEMMVGRKVLLEVEKKPARPGKSVLRVENLEALDNRKLPALKRVNLEVRAGEILAVAGVDGNGQTELIEALTGLRPASGGRIFLEDQDIANRTPRQIIELGVGHIPEDRQKRGLVLDFSIQDNLILEVYRTLEFCRYGFLDEERAQANAAELIARFDIRTPGGKVAAASLSGGNQQKVVVAREIRRNPKLLVVAQPTRGLDVGAIQSVHEQLVRERDNGKALLLFSLELDEIMALADRIAVIYEGEIVGVIRREEATEEKLGLMMTGGLRLNSNAEAVNR